MTDKTDFANILAQLIEVHKRNELANPSDMHLLADNRYEPAKAFFIQCLDDNNKDWRYDCLNALGHFVLDEILMEKIKQMSLYDESQDVRSCAISVWASQKETIDHHLLSILDNDEDTMVKETVLSHILTKYIRQIYPLTIRDVKKRIVDGEFALNSAGISDFLAKFGVKLI